MGVGGERSRGRGIKQIPGQMPLPGRYLESQKWRASRPLEENTGTRETAGRDRERDMRDMRAGRGEKLKGRGERGKRPGENEDPTQTAHTVTCPPHSNNGPSTGLPSDIALWGDHGPCDICDLSMALCNRSTMTSESTRRLVPRSQQAVEGGPVWQSIR